MLEYDTKLQFLDVSVQWNEVVRAQCSKVSHMTLLSELKVIISGISKLNFGLSLNFHAGLVRVPLPLHLNFPQRKSAWFFESPSPLPSSIIICHANAHTKNDMHYITRICMMTSRV